MFKCFFLISMKLLGHLLWVAKNVAEKENLNDSGYRLGKYTAHAFVHTSFTLRSIDFLTVLTVRGIALFILCEGAKKVGFWTIVHLPKDFQQSP